MAIDVLGTCTSASSSGETPTLAVFLTVLFAVYIALDSVLASAVIVRKAAEAEATTAKALG